MNLCQLCTQPHLICDLDAKCDCCIKTIEEIEETLSQEQFQILLQRKIKNKDFYNKMRHEMTEIQKQLKENVLYKKNLLDEIELQDDPIKWLNENILDIEYVVDSSKNYLGVSLLLAYGGPTIRYNTRSNSIEGHWGTDSYTIHYNSEFIENIFEEIFNS